MFKIFFLEHFAKKSLCMTYYIISNDFRYFYFPCVEKKNSLNFGKVKLCGQNTDLDISKIGGQILNM